LFLILSPPKKLDSPVRAARQGGSRGGMPNRPSGSPAARARAQSQAENFAFPFRRIFWWGAQSQNVRQNFLRGRPSLAAAGGGQQFLLR